MFVFCSAVLVVWFMYLLKTMPNGNSKGALLMIVAICWLGLLPDEFDSVDNKDLLSLYENLKR